MKHTTTRLRYLALAAMLATAAASCSDDGKKSDDSSPATTAAPTQSTAPGDPATTVPSVTLPPAEPGTVYPLTGLPITDEAAAARPALVVKIDNDASARPQAGLNAADIVFEHIIELQTRFAAVFHSQGSDPVGPIRSARETDVDLLGSLNQPLFVYSGGNPSVTAAIDASDFVNLSALDNATYTGGGFFRDDARPEPSNEMATTTQLWSLAPDGAGPPAQQFHYRAEGNPLVGEPASGVDVYLEGLLVGWRYDAASGLYLRTNDGVAHVDASGEQITTKNVIVMVVDYPFSVTDARSPQADSIGYGEVWVFCDGSLVRGVWTRADRFSPIELTGPNGPIALTPGRTWVELARVGTFTAVP